MITKLAMVSALLLAMPFEAVAAKVKVKFIDQEKKAILKSESKLVEKNSAKEYFGKVNKKGGQSSTRWSLGTISSMASRRGICQTSLIGSACKRRRPHSL